MTKSKQPQSVSATAWGDLAGYREYIPASIHKEGEQKDGESGKDQSRDIADSPATAARL